MEHRNSTVLSSARSLADDPIGLLDTLSHELFHAWNVERIRPRSLEPFDLEAASLSRELWFAEGFTSYYGDLIVVRIGARSLVRYAESLADTLGDVLNAPGRELYSPAEMSARAPFVDAATANDPTNEANTFISYYTYGNAIALGLDLMLRRRDPDLSLDTFMRAAWERFGESEIPYSNDELESLLAEVTGDADFARALFQRSIHGREPPDFAPLLEQAGLLLRRAKPGAAWIGDPELVFTDDGALLEDPSRRGSPLHAAGVDRGDRLRRLDGSILQGRYDLDEVLDRFAPGDVVELVVETRAGESRRDLTLAEDPTLEVVTFEAAGRDLSEAALAFRRSWLGAKAAPRTTVHRYCPETGEPYPLAWEHCPVHGSALTLVRQEAAEDDDGSPARSESMGR
jgi:predicted metalloprotease with PDZ domain